MDIFPTICKIANIHSPNEHIIDDFNLQHQLNGHKNKNRNDLFLNHFTHGKQRTNYFTSLVKSDWKVIYHYQIEAPPVYELFNLKDDPFETNNLAVKNPKQLKVMMKVLSDEMKNKKALFPEKEGTPLKLILPKPLESMLQLLLNNYIPE
ncbi:sulfatase/phosphatase domain-containing protein [Aquimarina sp. 2201CG1-2-11]|uniref:sulfatase/phosphatase domain-containing protein n=1 Tax=Aquimarina discodermiae TaxID=3231043 RepID=UPI003462C3FC